MNGHGAEKGFVHRHRRIRKKVRGTAERPRLSVHRSHLHLYAQMIDDNSGKTMAACSTLQKGFQEGDGPRGNVEAARRLGEKVAEAALAAGIQQVVFDRGGYRYHGRVKALADAAREKGIRF